MRDSTARRTLEKGRFYIQQAELVATSDRRAFEHFLEASIVFGRSVTFHLQKEFSRNSDFKKWYTQKQTEMASDDLFGFLKHKRNYILKEGPIAVPKIINVNVAETLGLSDSVEAHVIRGKPWNKRSLKILLHDIVAPIRGMMNRWHQKLRKALPKKRLEVDGKCEVEERLYFADEQWCDRAATDLIREYLAKLDKIVEEAEERFMSTK